MYREFFLMHLSLVLSTVKNLSEKGFKYQVAVTFD